MTFAYRFAGVPLRSHVALAGLREDRGDDVAEHRLDISFEPGPAPSADQHIFAWPGRYETRLGTIGDDWLIGSRFDGVFRIDRAITRVRLYSAEMPPSAASVDVLVRRILPRLMAARGAATIHAAAVATAGAGLLLLGASGAGKSTTTAALATLPEWDVFSDDLSIVWDGAVPLVAPAATGVCVWRASRDGLGIDPALCHAMPGYDGKFRFEPSVPLVTAAVPLRAFVFLARDPTIDAPRLTTMNRAHALIEAARQLTLFNPAAPPSEEYAPAIARLNRIARGAKMLRLSYPSRFDALPAVAETLAQVARE